jgi:predicted SnoaL-like aldol condensation-catalyzing enzyme
VSALSTAERNKQIIRDLFVFFNEHEVDEYYPYLHEDYVQKYPPPPAPGIEGDAMVVDAWRSAFPDYRFILEHQIAEGDWVANRYRFRGTHLGEFAGHPPTGRDIEVVFMDQLLLKDGKILENWWTADQIDALIQLELAPEGARPWGWTRPYER